MRKLHWIFPALLGGMLLVVLPLIGQNDDPAMLFEAAQKKALVDGDLNAAIGIYQQVLATAGADRSLAARALVELGECYERLGNSEAREAYERIVNEYPDQQEQVTTAQAKLAAMGAANQQSAGVTIRKLELGGGPSPANISADGRYVGATDYDTANAAIVDLVAGRHWNVTDYGNWSVENGYADQSAISRDGKRLAFWHYMENPAEGLTMRVVNADGAGEKVLLNANDIDRWWGIPTDWSPDGQYIAVELEGSDPDNPEGQVIDFALLPSDGGELLVLKTSPLTSRHRPKFVFSPDGRYVAYDFPPQYGARQADVYVLAVSGSQETVVAASPSNDTFVGWTPSGDVLFLSDRTGTIGLYRIAIKDGLPSGTPQLLKDSIGDIGTLGITASGSLYYWDSRAAWNSYFASIDLATGELLSQPEPVTDRFEDSVSMPSWSADGRYFSFLRHGSGSAASTLVIRDVATGKERELLPTVSLPQRGSKVRWRPDGESLMAIGAQGDQTGLFRINAETGESTLLYGTQRIQPYASGDWSPDANFYFHRPRGENEGSITRRDLETGNEEVIFTGSSRNHRVSPDGKLLAFVQSSSDSDWLGVVPTAGGTVTRLATRGVDVGRFGFGELSIAWTKDSRYVLFVTDPAITTNDAELWIVPSAGGEVKKTELPAGESIGEISFDLNSDRLAYSTVSEKTDFWVMENFLQ